MPSPCPRRQLLAGVSATVRLALLPAALLTALAPAPALALAGGLNAEARLENRGWINPALVPAPASASAAVPGVLAAESWYVAPPGAFDPPPPWQVGAAGFGRAQVVSPGTHDASVQHGTAALARAVANATGRASSTLSAQWQVDVVVNPMLAGPVLGPALYAQVMDTLGCPGGAVLYMPCTGGERGFSFLHLTQGSFHVTNGQATARAGFRESLSISGSGAAVTLEGGALYAPSGRQGELGVTWSGGWSAADASAMPLHEARTVGLYPAGDTRNDLPDPFGLLVGTRLEVLRPLVVSSGFQIGVPHYLGSQPLPFARFTLQLEQEASAGWDFAYGFGTVAANFDGTATTRLLGIEGLTLTAPDGTPVPLASVLQVHLEPISPVPEPATALLFALGAAGLWLRSRRRFGCASTPGGVAPRLPGRPRRAFALAPWLCALGLGPATALNAVAQAAPPPGWAPAQVELRVQAQAGTLQFSDTATGTLARPSDRVELAPPTQFFSEALGSSYTWSEAVGTARAEAGALRARAYGAGGQVIYEVADDGRGLGGGYAEAGTRLLDRLWAPASGYATLDLALTGGLGGSSTGAAAGWPNWSGYWSGEGTVSWRLGTMPGAVSAYTRTSGRVGATDGVPYAIHDSEFGGGSQPGLVPGWQLLALGPGVAGAGALGVQLRFNVVAGSNPFELGLDASAYCYVAAGGLGMLNCSGVSDLGSTLRAGNLALFNHDGSPMAGAVFSASGYDWSQPLSAVPEPHGALLALLGVGVLMARRLRAG